ncbi:bifunctional heptose 7-phosphate kinase/heptose 1-phosphate adenyltransferase [Idiomarina tyrosinivorans]|uniref:Bifunctional protein HldE n=1 Tax=Idiomarina tyrosinivorans TaxID=1445662 RepID=A0A432ZJT9_9GAMM|nr:bifunctional D-glycero-beta-D-manno-heptose-7-phosphate kinase/D-glycero-beta-D-manno-heptose 1-phosphate adenylyltransferase HldE [Idiomarina tyrosinivorans]RUO78183.1 bifunctional heptose 7-phosphate kinase/heptose 1-phosphate adenyltransferase [Idiomarina tyrosinivorans]
MDVNALNAVADSSVLVVGDVMLDRYFRGDTQRISPEAPVPVVKLSATEDRVGGAANVAVNIATLGASVGLLGLVGNDSEAQQLQQALTQHAVNFSFVSVSDKPTITKTRVISRHQQVVRLDREERFSATDAEQLRQRFDALLNHYDIIVFSDYNKGALQHVSAMISAAKRAGKMVLVDPKQPQLSHYRGADVITPNLNEFALYGGDSSSEESMLNSARALIAENNIAAMLLTRSEHGMTLILPQQQHHFAAQVLEVSDVTGAGDTVIATLAAMLGIHLPLDKATEMANLAAGIAVSKQGAVAVTSQQLAEKLNQQLAQQQPAQHPSDSEIRRAIAAAQQRGEKIVFTNGCFDILHAGHVFYLNQARALGQRLVVGLNSDASVKRLKGPQRPVNSLADRRAVLEGLACVDWVLPFGDNAAENDTPLQLIQSLNPNVLVKGGDYQISDIVGAEWVQNNGGEVKVLPFLDGRSTTSTINKLKG